jgi:hypothetical protein
VIKNHGWQLRSPVSVNEGGDTGSTKLLIEGDVRVRRSACGDSKIKLQVRN